jgi:uncharacterized protein
MSTGARQAWSARSYSGLTMVDAEPDLDAGDFSVWLTGMQEALQGERASDVPCHGCTACCTSSQFVLVEPDETETLARIPAALLFPAPRRPRGHVVLGYDERGHCPMLVDGRCSIYEHRPRACRTYDCRVFPAAGVEADQPAIARRTRRWRFSYAEPADHDRHDAVRAAAVSLRARHDHISATEVAVRAVSSPR